MDQLTVSAMYGVVEAQYTNNPAGDPTRCPSISDEGKNQTGGPITGCGPGGTFGTDQDENTLYESG